MNLYLVTDPPLSYGEYNNILVVADSPDSAIELAQSEYSFDEDCRITFIGKAARTLIAGDLVMGSCS